MAIWSIIARPQQIIIYCNIANYEISGTILLGTKFFCVGRADSKKEREGEEETTRQRDNETTRRRDDETARQRDC